MSLLVTSLLRKMPSLFREDHYMKKLAFTILSFSLLVAPALAERGNKPCSGKKGGVSHCANGKFVCHNGSISKSKKVCSK